MPFLNACWVSSLFSWFVGLFTLRCPHDLQWYCAFWSVFVRSQTTRTITDKITAWNIWKAPSVPGTIFCVNELWGEHHMVLFTITFNVYVCTNQCKGRAWWWQDSCLGYHWWMWDLSKMGKTWWWTGVWHRGPAHFINCRNFWRNEAATAPTSLYGCQSWCESPFWYNQITI